MATDFWASSHYKRWIVDRATLRQARTEDLQYVDDPEYLDFLAIYFANLISKLGRRLQFRQRVNATATVFFRRFYLKNSYCETDPFIVIAACCYVAAKAEESPVHIKNVVAEARMLFGTEEYGIKSFPSDNSKIAEMEFYLVDDLECDLTVFHPYRTLMMLCGKTELSGDESEAGELTSKDGTRYWGTGEGKLELSEGPLQMAWFIINDSYRSELCLLYPPHLIAIAAIYLTLVLHSPTRDAIRAQTQFSPFTQSSQSQPSAPQPTRRSSRTSTSSHFRKPPQDVIGFMAGLNVSLPLVATIAQEMISLYSLWDRYVEDAGDMRGAFGVQHPSMFVGSVKRTHDGAVRGGSVSTNGQVTPAAPEEGTTIPQVMVTPAFLTRVLLRMREGKMADLSHPSSGRPVAVNKMLERAQAAG